MILSQTFETCYSKLTGLQFTLSNGLAFFKREVTSANLSSSINVAFLIELTIYNISIKFLLTFYSHVISIVDQ